MELPGRLVGLPPGIPHGSPRVLHKSDIWEVQEVPREVLLPGSVIPGQSISSLLGMPWISKGILVVSGGYYSFLSLIIPVGDN